MLAVKLTDFTDPAVAVHEKLRVAVRLCSAARCYLGAIRAEWVFEERVLAALRESLGEQVFREEWDRGKGLDFNEALVEAERCVASCGGEGAPFPALGARETA